MSGLTLVERIEALWTANSPGNREKRAAILADVRELPAQTMARAIQVVSWHRNDYNGAQIDPILLELRRELDRITPTKTGAIKGENHG